MILCPECESEIDVDEDTLDEGEVVSCAECGNDFEVITLEPLELAPVSDEDEEDDDDEDDGKVKVKDDDDEDEDDDDDDE
jgi:alpha-aminoadipate carrier protein LysW